MTVDEMLERAFDLRGTPPNTRRTYTYCVHHFERFVGGPITELGRQQVEQFLLHLVRERRLGASSHNVYAAALRFLYDAALDRPEVMVRVPRRKQAMRLPVLLAPAEIVRLLAAIPSIAVRTIVMLAYAAGLRVSEACKLRVEDIDSRQMLLHIRNGKRGRERYVMLSPRMLLADGVDGLYDRRRGNGERKADERFDQVLVRLLGRTPQDYGWQRPTWTRELLCLQMKLEGFPVVAVCTMGRALSRVGARLGTPKPIVLCPWRRERKLRVLASIRRLEARASAREPVLYSDEVDIHLNPKIGRDWMLRGHQRRIVTPGKNQKFYLAGALDVRTGRLHTTGADRKNAALFCQLLWLLASRYRRARCIHLVLDNYGIHKATLTRKTLAAFGDRIVLHFLPPYCPDFNRIERVWQDFHANVTRTRLAFCGSTQPW